MSDEPPFKDEYERMRQLEVDLLIDEEVERINKRCVICTEEGKAHTFVHAKAICMDCVDLIVGLFKHRAKESV